ncbi:malonate decarboxylase holo-[acyl-carrier-protein] synthase [Hydrogenophaga sp. PAMC20947]|uniref:malonate decarboxylase holo-[acyl-carrier-protein] synthase n=1 Tax=Hydrogenophaga sp. PAMC20947 TaxID=2565558 RepID=UPI001447FF8E|nr:malonate decarboxylase holo-[acyl-carrier-protein] synthase [Hydrogenophaga sp. PAMC20947]
MPYLVRHRLIHLRKETLWQLADRATTEHECSGLRHWADHHLPLVVTRQGAETPPHLLSLGLPLPLQWGRLKLGFLLPRADVVVYASFPTLTTVTRSLAQHMRPLVYALQKHGLQAHVHGSYGWQTLSGLTYVHEVSDLDLLIRVNGERQADLATEALSACETDAPRLDGELIFPNGAAVAWREWAAWRSGKTPQYLVKTLLGAHLASSLPGSQATLAA